MVFEFPGGQGYGPSRLVLRGSDILRAKAEFHGKPVPL